VKEAARTPSVLRQVIGSVVMVLRVGLSLYMGLSFLDLDPRYSLAFVAVLGFRLKKKDQADGVSRNKFDGRIPLSTPRTQDPPVLLELDQPRPIVDDTFRTPELAARVLNYSGPKLTKKYGFDPQGSQTLLKRKDLQEATWRPTHQVIAEVKRLTDSPLYVFHSQVSVRDLVDRHMDFIMKHLDHAHPDTLRNVMGTTEQSVSDVLQKLEGYMAFLREQHQNPDYLRASIVHKHIKEGKLILLTRDGVNAPEMVPNERGEISVTGSTIDFYRRKADAYGFRPTHIVFVSDSNPLIIAPHRHAFGDEIGVTIILSIPLYELDMNRNIRMQTYSFRFA